MINLNSILLKIIKKKESTLISKPYRKKSKLKKTKLNFPLYTLSIPDLESYKILSKYHIGPSTVYITTNDSGKVYYLVDEPKLEKIGKLVYSKIMGYLYISLTASEVSYNIREELIKRQIKEISKVLGIYNIVNNLIDTLQYYIIRDTFGYGIIDVLMKDSEIEDISEESFEKPIGISHRKFGHYGILDTNISFKSLEDSNLFVQKLVQKTGKSLTAAIPYVDTMTTEGHRVAATFGKEVSLPGPNFTIRKFTDEPFTIIRLIQTGTISPLLAAYMWILLDAKAFALVIGSTAAGKTTTIGALHNLIHPQHKITTIEDTPELMISQEHWQRLITRKSSGIFEGKFDVSMDELVRLSLRSRPDYVVVGEVRGKEISSLIQAAATGHGGITSFHATDAKSALARMQTPPMNVHKSGQMIISVMLRQSRLMGSDGSMIRRITDISEVIPDESNISLQSIFWWDAEKKKIMPEDMHELISSSFRLKEISQINGWSEDDLHNELYSKKKFLTTLLKENKLDFRTVTNEISKYYFQKNKLQKDKQTKNNKQISPLL